MNDFVLFHPKSPNFNLKSVHFLLADCFVTLKIFIIFCKTPVRAQNPILVIPYNSVVRIEDTALKWSFIVSVGCLNKNTGKNWILKCLKYILMFVNM